MHKAYRLNYAMRALLLSPVLVLALTPGPASACEPGPNYFTFVRLWPLADAGGVPTDGIVFAMGYAYADPDIVVEVQAAGQDVPGQDVPGALVEVSQEHFMWRSQAPLEPGTEHTVHVESLYADGSGDLGESRDFTFVTDDGPAPAPPASQVSATFSIEDSFEECSDAEYCSIEFVTVEVPPTYVLDLDIAAPDGGSSSGRSSAP